jgi:hypothetical protein
MGKDFHDFFSSEMGAGSGAVWARYRGLAPRTGVVELKSEDWGLDSPPIILGSFVLFEKFTISLTDTVLTPFGKIHVPRRINQVQLVSLPVLRLIQHRHRMRLDRDAPFLLQVHRIQQLILHLPRRDRPRPMQQPVRKRRLPMINMGDDAEISYMRRVH